MSKDYKSIFENMTDEDLENFFTECGIKFEKVEPGKGGFVIKEETNSEQTEIQYCPHCGRKLNNE